MKKKTIINVLIIVLASLTVITGICNLFHNKAFFSASITQILTLAIALGIAFWATQYKTDIRKMKEHAEEVIRKLQTLVSETSFYSIPKDGEIEIVQRQINSTNRKINNCITVLEEYSKTLEFDEKIKYIRNEFETYKSRVGEHINDLDYLSKSEDEFKRVSDNIDTKCDYIIMNLYK